MRKSQPDFRHHTQTCKRACNLPTTLLVYAIATLIFVTACGGSTGQPETRQNVIELIKNADTKRQQLRASYGDSLLSKIESFQQAQLSYQRASALVEANNINQAVPHARSAVALLEDANLGVMQREFDRLRSAILNQQLALIKLSTTGELAENAEVYFRQALQDYRTKKIKSALEKMKTAQSQYEAALQSAKGSN